MERVKAGPGDRSRPRARIAPEVRVYRDIDHDGHWVAWSANVGWVRFWARPNGWAERLPIADLGDFHLCEVPLAQAFRTHFIEAFQH